MIPLYLWVMGLRFLLGGFDEGGRGGITMFIQVFQVQLHGPRISGRAGHDVAPGDQPKDNRILGVHFRRYGKGVHDHSGSLQVGGGRESGQRPT